ncbi:putative phage protein [Brachyspira pilosicoli WesB]|uniref:Putative phage protein n=1 Tax=Brachyspira pilosicoli WesB TaxID=1161918 RepID=K0JF37_BRAPL|nr:terminase family protein [Brachyspira pilosicoli]CCG55773.1 putative phage protein [Brachyspira pilosicoli WesB]
MNNKLKNKKILLAYQEKWLINQDKVKVWQKSRRIGASYVEALNCVLKASLSKKENGMSCYYISYAKDMTQQFIKDAAFWAKVLNIACEDFGEIVIKDENKDITIYKIRFESGFEIWGLPSVPRSIRSKQGHIVIDEAAFCDDLKELLKAALAMLMWGGSVSILSTHNGEDNQFNLLIKDIENGRKNYYLQTTDIDEALKDGLYKKICEISKEEYSKSKEREWLKSIIKDYGEAYEEELYCIPSRNGEKYFNRALLETVANEKIKVFRFYEKDDFTFKSENERYSKILEYFNITKYLFENVKEEIVLGEDFARSGDLTVLWFERIINDNTSKTLCVIELKNIPFSNQEQFILLCLNELNKKFIGAAFDSRGNGQMIAENLSLIYRGLILQVMITRKWYSENMPKLKSAIEDKITNIPKDNFIIDDFLTAEIYQGIPLIKERTGSKNNKRHGDSLIAKTMAVYAMNELIDKRYQPITYEPISTKNAWRL